MRFILFHLFSRRPLAIGTSNRLELTAGMPLRRCSPRRLGAAGCSAAKLIAFSLMACLWTQASYADYASTVLADNPVAYYRLDEPMGTEVTVDASGHGHDSVDIQGTEFGREGVCGGTAVEFSGRDSSILLDLRMDPANPSGEGSGEFSIESWINVDRRAELSIISQQDGNGKGRSNLILDFTSRISSWHTLRVDRNSGFRPKLDTWYHVVFSVDAGEQSAYFYVDGQPARRNPVPIGRRRLDSADGQWVLGAHKSRTFQEFRGLLDEVAFYDYRLDDPNGDGDTSDSRVGAHFAACNAALPGDFDGDGELSSADLDQLSEAVRTMATDDIFDLDGNGSVNGDDRKWFVHELKNTYFGDANFDGEFNSTDMVEVFQAGEYEDDLPLNSRWATGDWDGNGEFESGDMVLAFQDGGYEQGPRAAVRAVPEPSCNLAATWAIILGTGCLRSVRFRLLFRSRRP